MTPPFVAGWRARKEGKPITANPYQPGPVTPDEYPGPHRNWAAGWNTRDWIIRHDAEKGACNAG